MAIDRTFYDAREEIIKLMHKDLVGPVSKDEILMELPTQYYVMGKLYPRFKSEDYDNNLSDINEDVTTNAGIDQNTDYYDSALSSTNNLDPSAMGVTFTLKPSVRKYRITVSFAMYEPRSRKEIDDTAYDIKKLPDDYNDNTIFWIRKEVKREFTFDADKNNNKSVEDQMYVGAYLHASQSEHEKLITVVLTNRYEMKGFDYTERNTHTAFQTMLRIESADVKEKSIFTDVKKVINTIDDPEIANLDMLYSSEKCYGQGHGCAIEWDTEHEDPYYIKSSFMPEYDLLQMKAVELEGTPVFNMKYLYTGDPEEVISELAGFMGKYEAWIKQLDEQVLRDDFKHKESAKSNIDACKTVCDRIKKTITNLKESAKNNGPEWRSFRLANEAMHMQRIQTLKKAGKPFREDSICWYPFQLAFFLLEIDSFIDPNGNDRKLVDLLWFPTGGGKTEAYLGIAAFCIFYRRFNNKLNDGGVTVIMRYTLRLLTIQQFERASALICACDILGKRYAISSSPIMIGLWVGNKLTPATLEDADRTLAKLNNNGSLDNDEADPCQLRICPWCGGKLFSRNYVVDYRKRRMLIKCNNVKCNYSGDETLPVCLIDEEIYSHRPTFLVATVDKFAQITLQDKPAAIFSVDGLFLPPELIIQDELHLISGPLGTMTGIYEAAITRLCERNGVPVKIVASTATIRNASKQIRALYGRSFSQFPPQGIDADDSFFAVRSKPEERPARKYIGIMGVGTTFTTTMIRVYASWLFGSRYLIDKGYDEKVIDNFWTMTGYFNSIRELGATQTQVVDDIQSRYQYLKENKFSELIPKYSGKEKYEYVEELTSRMTNDQISDIIQTRLKVPYTKEDKEDAPFDFILASNMISVGVDVGRLGTMAVAGQPKTTAEYIQATSRVGRDNPGLVFIVYNAYRSRDRSHYEQFLQYHSSLYRYVEATSLTPFSDRARDRGLQALFVTLCRYMCPGLLENDCASNFNPTSEAVKKIENIIFEYVRKVDERELENVIREIKDIEHKWEAETHGELWYHKKKKKSLLKDDIEEDDRFRCMNSMRSVEKQSGIYLLGE